MALAAQGRNNTKIATSGESFASKSNARRAAENVKATAPIATIPDDSSDAMNDAIRRFVRRHEGGTLGGGGGRYGL